MKLVTCCCHSETRGIELCLSPSKDSYIYLGGQRYYKKPTKKSVYLKTLLSSWIIYASWVYFMGIQNTQILVRRMELLVINVDTTMQILIDIREMFRTALTLILRRSRTGTVWFYTSTSNKRAARPKLYTKSWTRDLKLMNSRLTLVRISINL